MPTNHIEQIKNLLLNKGIAEHKLASTISSILGIHYNTAKQKLDGKRSFAFEELKSIFLYFNEDIIPQKKHNCVYIINNIHKRCNVDVEYVGEINNLNENETYAIKKDDIYIINGNIKPEGSEYYKIVSIDFLPAPEIAILDNHDDILNVLSKISNRYGINTKTFNTTDQLEKSMKDHTYDGYILDWLLDFNETPENLICKIRTKQNPPSFIILLTGELIHNEKQISKMIIDYGITLLEKPTKPLILSSFLLSKLFFI
ncbi:response regulator (plasmid) [Enterobacter sp. JBIWA003]|uniref:helix-turn-helix domain-containing protein n=1 Tax=Enterobacter sp. JBIWA003 TaxID=2831890 RepID=UPI001CBC7E59|nr:helix-turn-helix domain-containing protein [Enterobacter sp. JBIWA003]UAN25013.1 response regulator [Enterobacter sp. JBIWA003]